MLGKVLLLCGGQMDMDFAAEYLSDHRFDCIVCADSGLDAAYALHLPVDYIMGDFDSVSEEILQKYRSGQVDNAADAKFVQYPTAKDATDTEMVLDWILQQNPTEITILGATGGRMDHLLANIQILMQPLAKRIPAWIVDRHNRIRLADHTVELHRQDLYGKYISLIPLTEKVYPVTLQGFEYALEEYTMTIGSSLGVSNEMAKDVDLAQVSFQEGVLILIESRD
ncbi:MAG: thiamine diphosphokinase [Lachnospiraceae bacterium]|nr:thiamine diphosphokinase [Lachnospiraceae bacterium]